MILALGLQLDLVADLYTGRYYKGNRFLSRVFVCCHQTYLLHRLRLDLFVVAYFFLIDYEKQMRFVFVQNLFLFPFQSVKQVL